MNHMLCRNRVRNFARWKRVFDSQADAHRRAGLKLVYLWQASGNPHQVFFLFEVEDVKRARDFIGAPDVGDKVSESGLIEGEYHFFAGSQGYGPAVAGAAQAAVPQKPLA
jgi:hypothetical protein